MSNFFEELKKRNVYKVAVAYLVTSWLIIQVVNTIGPTLNWSDTLPLLIIKILSVGFPIALLVAWLFEITPQGLKLIGSKSAVENKITGRRLNYLIIGALAVTVCLLLAERFFFADKVPTTDIKKASIAVLPFENMSPDPANEFFADGLSEQIIDELVKISSLDVTARTSSFAFKDQNKGIREIATELGVNYVLEGSVRYDEEGNNIKITAQLINANDDIHLWSKIYDEDFENIFKIQESIGREVSKQLRIELLPEDLFALSSDMTDNPEAYKLYVKARQSAVGKDRDIQKSFDLLKEAIKIDPEFTEAHAVLSSSINELYWDDIISRDQRDSMGKYHIAKALKIAPENPEALKAKAAWRLYVKRDEKDSTEVIRDLKKVIQLNPSDAEAHYMLYQAVSKVDRIEAIRFLERASALNPINVDVMNRRRASAYRYSLGETTKALEVIDELIAKDSASHFMRTKASFMRREPFGDLAQSFIIIHSINKRNPDAFDLNGLGLLALGLDLFPYSKKCVDLLNRKYPDLNTWEDINAWFNRDTTEINEALEKRFPNGMEDLEYVIFKTYYDAMFGKYSEALETFEKAYPYYTSGDIILDSINLDNEYTVMSYIDILRLNKRNDKADNLADLLCQYYQNEAEKNPYGSWVNEREVRCYYISNDTIQFLEALEKRFFQKKDRAGVFTQMKEGWFFRFENIPEYQKLYNQIEAETHRMRAEVIEYLKKEGEWDPAWDEELGLE